MRAEIGIMRYRIYEFGKLNFRLQADLQDIKTAAFVLYYWNTHNAD